MKIHFIRLTEGFVLEFCVVNTRILTFLNGITIIFFRWGIQIQFEDS